jgi:hypothetical protein
MQTLRENPLMSGVLLAMSAALLVLWQPPLYSAIIWGALAVWLAVAVWRGPRNRASLWKPVWGWGWTAFFIIGGVVSLLPGTGTGFGWMGVFFLIAGVGNAIGLLWWPGRLRHQSPHRVD